jgi:rare lipoprotein A
VADSYVVRGKRYYPLASSEGYVERGVASWYGREFHGRPTSSGEAFDMNAMTGAHRTLPLPTWVEVTNLENGQRVVIRLNDRGPFHDDRLIDLSYAAASELGMVRQGTARVEVRAIDPQRVQRNRERLPFPPPQRTSFRERSATLTGGLHRLRILGRPSG